MLFFTIIAAFLVGVNGGILPPAERIIGGTPAEITDAPYQVAVLYDSGVGSFYYACGGSIISKNVILTAAHCTHGKTSYNWRIRAGSATHSSGGQVVDVSRIVEHAGYTSRFDNDIGLLFLAKDLTLSAEVAIIPLPVQGQALRDENDAFLVGWGALSSSGGVQPKLNKVIVQINNQMLCVAAYDTYNPVTNNMFCAGNFRFGGTGACPGDAGSGLKFDDVVVGIVSWGRSCGVAGYPGVFTRVPNYRNWIDSNM